MFRHACTASNPAGNGIILMMLIATTSPGKRSWLYDLVVGSSQSPPSTRAGRFKIVRCDDIGDGGTTKDGRPLDSGTSAPYNHCRIGPFSTTPPTVAANSSMLNISLNERQTFRWVARPGKTIVVAATPLASGIGLECTYTSGTPTINTTMHWEE